MLRLIGLGFCLLASCSSQRTTTSTSSEEIPPLAILIQDLAHRRNIRHAVLELRKALPGARDFLTTHREHADPLVRGVCRTLLANPASDYEWYSASGLISLDLQVEQWWRWLRERRCGNAIMEAELGLNTLKLLSSAETCIYDSKHDQFVLTAPATGRPWEEVAVVCSEPMSYWKPRIHKRLHGESGPTALQALIEYVQEIGGDLSLEHPGELTIQTKAGGFSHWSTNSRALWRPDVANGPAKLVLDILNNWEWLRVPNSEIINLEDTDVSR